MLYLKNDKTWMGGVCAKVAGNVKTNHVTEYWPQGSRVRYANELINMQKHYNSSTKVAMNVKFGHKNHSIADSFERLSQHSFIVSIAKIGRAHV